ncbi:hypothetical protein [Amycolatopsis sp. NPDC049159]|uniref:hypothetical protein n=1 Tax=Amycolatopsis sp. NPDC049159 TaxID=3157210 RepID=UPI0033F5327F
MRWSGDVWRILAEQAIGCVLLVATLPWVSVCAGVVGWSIGWWSGGAQPNLAEQAIGCVLLVATLPWVSVCAGVVGVAGRAVVRRRLAHPR